jgi:hypothetical protein
MAIKPGEEKLHWSERTTTVRLPWSLGSSTASSQEWILDADDNIIGFVFFTHDRDRKAFLDAVNGV